MYLEIDEKLKDKIEKITIMISKAIFYLAKV